MRSLLESLLLDNPQDPFLPTPPEVLKRCKRFDYDWWKPTAEYLIEGKAWAPPRWAADCPAPGTKGHPLTLDQIRKQLKPFHWWRWVVLDFEAGEGGEIERKLELIRSEMFKHGERERILAKREAVLERKRQAAEEARKEAAQRREEQRIERERREQEEARWRAEDEARQVQFLAEVAHLEGEARNNAMWLEEKARARREHAKLTRRGS